MKKKKFTIEWDESDKSEWADHYSPRTFEVEQNGDGSLEFSWAEQYEAPTIQMKFLSALSVYFGTTDIDVIGDIHERGCETCDYGSLYGHTLRIRNVTQNNPFDN